MKKIKQTILISRIHKKLQISKKSYRYFPETDTRGRRGSGTASRSSSPVGSDEPDESEADQTPTRGSRSRKKSGRTGGTADNTESAPPSPSGNIY